MSQGDGEVSHVTDAEHVAVKVMANHLMDDKDTLSAISHHVHDVDGESHVFEGSLDESSQDKDVKPFLIVSPTGTAAFDVGTLEMLPDEPLDGEPPLKRYRVQADDGQSYILTVTANGSNQGESLLATEHQYQARQDEDSSVLGVRGQRSSDGVKRNQLLKADVSQAWFTTRDDKNILQKSGASWKQGQWTKEEVDILQSNIAAYCQEHDISDPTVIIFEMSKDDRKQFYRTIAKGLQRPLFSVYRRVTRMYDQKNHIGKYTQEEMQKLKELRTQHGSDWASIGQALGRSASSVKDKCRLMKDMCNSGKWLPEEERRLTQAVYDLVGGRPGEDVVHGLSWALVAERVITRSEKQCRTKWLNYMNWKMKGGREWTREDDINLIARVANLSVEDDTEIDWDALAKDWPSARSPQWLRGKWWQLKKNIPDYHIIPFKELLHNMETVYVMNVRVRNTIGTARTRRLETHMEESLSDGLQRMSDDSLSGVDVGSAYEVLQHLPSSCGSYIITQSPGSIAHTSTEHIIVQTLPICQISDGDLGLSSHVVIRLPSGPDLSDGEVTLEDQSDITSAIQLSETIDTSQQGLEVLSDGSVISRSDSLNDDNGFSTHTLEESVTSSPRGVGMVLKQQSYAPVTNGQLMTSYSDPMLNSNSSSLMGPTSDVETDKSQPDDMIVNI
ncbi:cyclin-D-binding Myb-like transcription factor 1 isoform X2 [Dreissena polymorpha]|uniref:Cyclin-D-binding Myb-like transcription factor 1 n=2 Tax=Dreissena polymorpha TaxID=45954 RepID=A0A9D4S578_DREPO|nr:cyclin-D-binding Myb-like transcription factor 1 isoform X2 [Dreissena polymorpha]XP_052252304.1 cyclin-D-binding Myb-like transcription factor 1 isoform X2 [Dreissena polymorpha]XP_052252312.1 cyclin-D-binding Myb-like transcription factor 1 isoform X2 [Dreissena polymorpha]XP_052252320.1 cyclin-D-binding Myb-like transcription factor 1 isoform X2 [Dreissena polymorpha]XP_052252327.1 cyclin-D-binding Myb-like transcription factor 1 isoform X2 [Dreissena polymorpha]KAH3893054.1 hypothetical